MSVVREEFRNELIQIHDKITRMGGLTLSAIADAVDALVEMDSDKAQKVMDNDDLIDEMEREIDRACVEMIIRQQPVGRGSRDHFDTEVDYGPQANCRSCSDIAKGLIASFIPIS